MFDQTFEESKTRTPAVILNLPKNVSYLVNTSVMAASRFNPFESIVGITPITFYETLAILNQFNVLGCTRGFSNPAEFSYLDLDDTEGFSMAIQGRCPRAYCYSLYNTSQRRKWNFERNGLDTENFNLDSSCYKTLLARSLLYNTQGLLVSFVSLTLEESSIWSKIRTGVNVLSVGGTCLIRFDYAQADAVADAQAEPDIILKHLTSLESMFQELIIYKPAVTSATSTECYLICLNKIESTYYVFKSLEDITSNKLKLQIAELESRRVAAEYSISKNVDNRAAYDISKAKVRYLTTQVES